MSNAVFTQFVTNEILQRIAKKLYNNFFYLWVDKFIISGASL